MPTTAPPTDAPTPHKPYVPDASDMPEFTWQAVVTGAVLGIVFGASSLYLVLKVGMTVSASIPVAVLAVTLFRALSKAFGLRKATILENNIVQTTGSAGESIAFGVGVTMPGLMLLGFDMDLGRVMVVSVLGGILGILMMIPLRRAFVVRLHGRAGEPGKLLYPEGTACAQVLISAEKGGAGGAAVFVGFGIAFVHKFLSEGMNLIKTAVAYPLSFFNRAAVAAAELAPELLGVGYIIGLRTAGIMMAGGVLGYMVIAPAIAMFGDAAAKTIDPASKPIRDMSLGELRSNYILYIGAGCVAAAGIISMIRTLPLIIRSIRSGLASLRAAPQAGSITARAQQAAAEAEALLADLPQDSGPRRPLQTTTTPSTQFTPVESTTAVTELGGTVAGRWVPEGPGHLPRTEHDLPMWVVLLGSAALVAFLAVFMTHELHWYGGVTAALLVVVFGFLFVTVSSRLTGEIGSSSNPISGMTVATLALTCLIFLALGMTGPTERVLALSIGAVVCIAASNGGTTSQDLKTGFLVGGTPWKMQWAIIVGAVSSALVIGGTLLFFNRAGTVYSERDETFPLTVEYRGRLLDPKAEAPDQPDWHRPNMLLMAVSPDEKYLVATDTRRVHALHTAMLKALTETEAYRGETYHVWRPKEPEDGSARHWEVFGSGKYLIDAQGNIRYYVDPAVTGKMEDREDYVKDDLPTGRLRLPGEEVAAGKVWPKVGLRGVEYRRVIVEKDEYADVPEGIYLADDAGKIHYRVIHSKVNLKFEAPKTQVMALIINGVLGGKLNWALVIMGAMIAITLELAGVSSLAFAVGVYIPMGVSVPIFIGGLLRYGIDRFFTPKPAGGDEAAAIAETESSPGVLLSSGYIAGGTLAGVVVAFLEFSPTFKAKLNMTESVKGLGPAGADYVAMGAFGVLIVLLLITGMRLLLSPRSGPAYPVEGK
jgi:OPT family oligopeptide transporter